MSAFDLRPHHGLCIRFFQGGGYSTDFIANMYVFIRILDGDPLIRLCPACDMLCACCPHKCKGVCQSDARVQGFDQSVLALCGLAPGDTLRWSEFSTLVSDRILHENRLHEVCAACEWYPVCGKSEVLR